MKDEKFYLERILEIIRDLENYVLTDFEEFKNNQMRIDASIMKLQVLGETMKKVSHEYEGIPYKEIIGLRDWISHDYFGLDLESIWYTLKKDIPDLKEKINSILSGKL